MRHDINTSSDAFRKLKEGTNTACSISCTVLKKIANPQFNISHEQCHCENLLSHLGRLFFLFVCFLYWD